MERIAIPTWMLAGWSSRNLFLISPENRESLLLAQFAVLVGINVGIFKDIVVDISDELRESSLISVVSADMGKFPQTNYS